MTKEQFTSGTPFYINAKKYKGDSTYYFKDNLIVRQIRSSVDEGVILEDFECNVDKVGRLGFTGFTYVMGKKVTIKLYFVSLDKLVENVQEELNNQNR